MPDAVPRDLSAGAAELTEGAHLCALCDSDEGGGAAVGPFVRAGLARKERLLLFQEAAPADALPPWLAASGLDAGRLAGGQARIVTPRDLGLAEGNGSPDALTAFLERELALARREGMAGLRLVGGLPRLWPRDGDPAALMRFELSLTSFLRESRGSALCLYRRDQQPAAWLFGAVETHPYVVLDGAGVANDLYCRDSGAAFAPEESVPELDRRLARLRGCLAHRRALARRADLFQGIFDHMQSGVAVYQAVDGGEDFVFTDFNPAAERIEGVRKETLLGRRVSEVFPGVTSLGLFKVFQRVWRTGTPEQHPMARYQDDRMVSWRLNSVSKLPSGEIVAIYLDETERRRLELEREQLIAELKNRNTELERFTYTVSHDLKSPLVTIQGFAGLLAQDLAENNAESAAGDLERIARAAKTMQRLLEDLLELSRVGRFAGPVVSVSMNEIVSRALDLVAGRVTEHGVRVEVAPDLPVVSGDPMRLVQLMQNLLDNAVKFMDDQKRPVVSVGMKEKDGERVFFVRDNGRGIEPHYHQRIFDLFDRLDASGEGTGVGLALAKRVVELHGGRLWVESPGRGGGSCFWFTLPGPAGKDSQA